VTHDVVTADDFNGNRNAVAKVLRTFTVAQTIRWFEEMGVTMKREETGKLFPTTDRARTVVDALLRAAEGVEIRTGHRVDAITATSESHFALRSPHATFMARRVILATGGCSVPKTGSDGHGYSIAQSLGHTRSVVFPALVPLILEEGHWLTKLSGTSTDAELMVRASSGKVLARERGSMLFTHFGLSGPVVLDISRHWIAARREDPGATVMANLLPGETFESLEQAFLDRSNPRATVASVLRGRTPERLLTAITAPAVLSALTRDERRRIVRALVEMPLPVVRDRGFDHAEVTAGGVPLSEIDVSTMASRKREGLYLCGEILDVDGKIGGYNFQWAWASGRLAGIHAAKR
jgi:predicted Rossmann fold flavoprotein